MTEVLQLNIKPATKKSLDYAVERLSLDVDEAFEQFVKELRERADRENTDMEAIRAARLAARGSMEGEIWMADDFNAPLEELEEYMQ